MCKSCRFRKIPKDASSHAVREVDIAASEPAKTLSPRKILPASGDSAKSADFPVLPRVAVVRDHRADLARAGAAERGDQKQQLHQIIVDLHCNANALFVPKMHLYHDS